MDIFLPPFCDILNNNHILLASSNSKEKKAINDKLINKREFILNDTQNQKCYIGMLENTFIIHLTGSSGISATDSISRLIIEYISNDKLPIPAFAIIAGFCWGNPNNTKKGDILICNEIYSLNYRKVNAQGNNYKKLVFKSKFQIEEDIVCSLNNQIKTGKMVSTEKLFSSTGKRDEIIKKYPDIVGGEMEGFGCIPNFQKNSIPWLILKAVSDFGDNDYNMNIQAEMAQNAVNQITSIIQIIKDDNQIKLNLDNDFVNILTGDVLEVTIDNILGDDLNDYLNDIIGPIIEQKLEIYYVEKDENNTFIRLFCDLILEVLQNAFKHAGAEKVRVNFFQTKITIIETGERHTFRNLEELESGKGGFNAWRNIQEKFIDTNKVSYSSNKKKHEFKLDSLITYLKDLIENCKVSIIKSSIGSSLPAKKVIKYNNTCKEVYVDDTNVRMSSRRLALAREVKDLLDKGLKVYLLVNDDQNALMYRNVFSENIKNLKVVIK
ncbi:hypothetical protein LPB137_05230 [Poseidonibacter parvus]|uniref:Nucleoside phosphorylase domain-containing protein n=1 Tax=Poseidonibacter parvus TaxID=1850254 RepID=A0A1P8KL50_9BACT|nr:hypothetical protein [Poseidonibacter parvus]APW65292.1 hypothetical protein LPB137_05230 [Poseidonibacter parvus]